MRRSPLLAYLLSFAIGAIAYPTAVLAPVAFQVARTYYAQGTFEVIVLPSPAQVGAELIIGALCAGAICAGLTAAFLRLSDRRPPE